MLLIRRHLLLHFQPLWREPVFIIKPSGQSSRKKDHTKTEISKNLRLSIPTPLRTKKHKFHSVFLRHRIDFRLFDEMDFFVSGNHGIFEVLLLFGGEFGEGRGEEGKEGGEEEEEVGVARHACESVRLI